MPSPASPSLSSPQGAFSGWRAGHVLRLFVMCTIFGSPWLLLRVPVVQEHLGLAIDYLRSSGPVGIVLYLGMYCAGALFLFPLAFLSGLSGYAFGPGLGIALAVPGCVLGTAVAFSLGRLFARRFIRARLEGDARFHSIESVIGDRGFRVALLLRLSPLVPQSPLGYALSATRLPLPVFMLATLVGLFPVTLLHVWFGSLVGTSAALLRGEAGPRGVQAIVLTAAGIAITLAGVVFTARVARRSLARLTSSAPAASDL